MTAMTPARKLVAGRTLSADPVYAVFAGETPVGGASGDAPGGMPGRAGVSGVPEAPGALKTAGVAEAPGALGVPGMPEAPGVPGCSSVPSCQE
ncbi:hypothetical protein BDW66DRAFT_124429 [Aspergillus desertorum]